MNLTIASTIPNTWKRIRVQYVSLACGLALAVAALVGFAAWPESEGRDASPTVAASRPAAAAQVEVTYYIVGSEAEARAFEAASSKSIPIEGQRAIVIFAETQEAADQLLLDFAFAAGTAAADGAPPFSVVDLRGR